MLDIPPLWESVQADGLTVPFILFRASKDDKPRPTLIIGNGLDGSMEEMVHMHDLQVLERNYNVVLYEGLGQSSVCRQQNIGLIYDWERTVILIVDYLVKQPFVWQDQIILFGNSLGGYLAARAAAFEHRLAAVILVDGIYDVYDTMGRMIDSDAMELEKRGDEEGFIKACQQAMAKSVKVEWFVNQLCWAFFGTPFQVMQTLKKMTLSGIEDKITCPVFVAGAENDLF